MSACPYCGKGGKARSPDQLRRYFKLIEIAFNNWPEAHEFQPDNANHLRKWLQVKAGYKKVQEINISRTDPQSLKIMEATLRAAMTAIGDYAWIVIHGKKLYVVASLSISYDKMGHKEFCALNDIVASVIEREIGTPAAVLMNEAPPHQGQPR